MNGDVLDLMPDGVIVVAADRTVLALNRAAERLTGWNRDEATGRFYGEVLWLRAHAGGFLVHERADPFTNAVSMMAGTPERTYLLRTREGGERTVALRARYRWGEGGVLEEIVVTLRDAGRRERAERSAYDMIAQLAHDLRSPLTSVKGFASTILHRWEKLPDEAKQHMLRTIESDADRMTRLLKDLLDFSRLEAGRLELKREPVDLAVLAESVSERVQMDVTTHKIETEFAHPFPSVMADAGKLERVLRNLVENAVKHANPGLVRVSGRRDGGGVVLRVADSGPGIDLRHIPYVFTKFYRRSTGDRSSGSGLGLYICKGIVEAHGGEIGIERSDPSGTVFAFTLPLGDG